MPLPSGASAECLFLPFVCEKCDICRPMKSRFFAVIVGCLRRCPFVPPRWHSSVITVALECHHGGTKVPPRWNWCPTTVEPESHHDGTGIPPRWDCAATPHSRAHQHRKKAHFLAVKSRFLGEERLKMGCCTIFTTVFFFYSEKLRNFAVRWLSLVVGRAKTLRVKQ